MASGPRQVGTWQPLAPEVGLWQIDSWMPNGLPAHTLSLRLRDKSLLVIGPTAQLTARHVAALRKMGRISYILVPSTAWTHGLKDFGSKCPGAKYVAAKSAHEALVKSTGLKFETPWESLRDQVPELVQILVPDSLKNGEIWVRVQTRRGMAWIVSDTLVNYQDIPQGLAGWRYWIRGLGPDLRIPMWHKMTGIEDKGLLRSWIFERIREDRPEVLIPLHGVPLASPDLPRRLRAFVDDFLGNES
jgi:hypothetical protein